MHDALNRTLLSSLRCLEHYLSGAENNADEVRRHIDELLGLLRVYRDAARIDAPILRATGDLENMLLNLRGQSTLGDERLYRHVIEADPMPRLTQLASFITMAIEYQHGS